MIERESARRLALLGGSEPDATVAHVAGSTERAAVILVDSSVWIDQLRHGDPVLTVRLRQAQVLCHPFVIGELSLGNLRQRPKILDALRNLPRIPMAHEDEMPAFIDRHALHGTGIGYIDAHLLAATCLAPGSTLWTRDKRLRHNASRLKIGVVSTSNRLRKNLPVRLGAL